MPTTSPPAELPFLRVEHGLAPHQLRRDYRKLYRGVYLHRDVPVDAKLKARAAWLAAGRDCVVAGFSAAALLGVKWIPDDAPAQVTAPRLIRIAGVEAFRDTLDPGEVTGYGEIRVTDAVRTAFDLGRRLPLDEAVVMLDAIYQDTGVKPEWVRSRIERNPGARGVRRLAEALELSDRGAESPWETRTRLAVLRAGFPRPVTQFAVRVGGTFVARVDLAWPERKVAVEYDGAHHFTDARQARRDLERWNRLAAEGWTVVRVTRRQLESGAAELVEQLRRVLSKAA